MTRTIQFKALNWQVLPYDEDFEERFYVNGLTKDEKSVMIRLDGFRPYVNIEVPKNFTKAKAEDLFELMKKRLRNVIKDDESRNYAPIKFQFMKKFELYHKIAKNYMTVWFKTHEACKSLQYFFHTKLKSDIENEFGIKTRNVFKVHEQNIDPLIKLGATYKLLLGSWLEVTEYFPQDAQKDFSTCDYSMYVNVKNIKPITVSDTIQPREKILSFDIECGSENENSKLPDPLNPKNKIEQISIHTCRMGDDKIKKHLLTIRKGVDIKVPDTIVFNCKSEKDLLLTFTRKMIEFDPDILLGYNILKFDWDYILKRVELLGISDRFLRLGRIDGEKAHKKIMSWSSSAYGDQKFQFLEIQGRMNLDLFPEIERNYKFDTYSLDFVSEHFLGDKKKPVSPKQMFKLMKFSDTIKTYYDHKITDSFYKNIKTTARIMFDDVDGVLEEFKQEILNSTKENILDICSKAMAIVGDYCVHDSVLPIRLLSKLKIKYTLEQMTNIYHVPVSYLQTRGQQIKGLAQVFRYTLYHNYVIPYRKAKYEIDYEGATVIDAVPGYYKDIATLDFASLYPTVIIANNIDYTTYIDPKNNHISDSDCNVIEWESHVGCDHDKKKKTTTRVVKPKIETGDEKPEPKKKKRIICGKFRHRFLKAGDNLEDEGVIPHLLRGLLAARKQVKKDMFITEEKLKNKEYKDEKEKIELELLMTVLNAKQLAIKVSANSMYGMMGAKTGYMPLVPGAAAVTARGRQYINISINHILKEFEGAKLVYGDSVTSDTPILVRKFNYEGDSLGSVDIISIDELHGNNNYKPYDNFKIFDETIRTEKQYSECDYEVWTDKGWSKIRKVIRHKVDKNIYRVSTHTGSVDVTEDHSLLTPNLEKVKPKEVKIGDKLLTSLPILNEKIKIYDNDKEKVKKQKEYLNNLKSSSNIITQIKLLGKTTDFVYDLETECGRFQAGVGEIIVKNTDSCMIKFDCKTTTEVFELGRKASKKCTALFPPPVELEFECVYGKFFLLTKKRYIAYMINEKGEVKDKIKKGVVAKRRDNTHYLKNIYNKITDEITNDTPFETCVEILGEWILKLFTRQIPDKDLIIYKGIKTIMGYAKTVELPDPKGKIKSEDIIDEKGNIFTREQIPKISYFIDANKPKKGKLIDRVLKKNNGMPEVINDPLDPRLLYDNTAHVQLALKMIKRGDDVPPNTRLQYVFLDTGNVKELQSEKIEDYIFYKENKHSLRLKLDPLYYLEKQVIKPLTEAISVAYLKEKPYLTLQQKIEKLEEQIFKNLPDRKDNILNLKKFIIYNKSKEIPRKKEEIIKFKPCKFISNEKVCKHMNYQSAINLSLSRVGDEKMKSKLKKLINLYFIEKSEMILTKIETNFGNPKRKKPIRKNVTTYIPHGNLLTDIYKYRTNYREVIGKLNESFKSELIFE